VGIENKRKGLKRETVVLSPENPVIISCRLFSMDLALPPSFVCSRSKDESIYTEMYQVKMDEEITWIA